MGLFKNNVRLERGAGPTKSKKKTNNGKKLYQLSVQETIKNVGTYKFGTYLQKIAC